MEFPEAENQQKQNQQILLWQQEAYRSISDQLVQISSKYTSYTSSTNLMSAAFFEPSIITSLGKYADMISASGNTNSDIQIGEVHNLAQTETVSFSGLNGMSNADTISGSKTVDLTGDVDVSNFGVMAREILSTALEENGVELSGLVTFHDGFRYFAQFLDVPLLASIEEEEGSEASAKEINEITALVKEHDLPVIFTEANGSDATAQAISRETGCAVAQLTMLMDGPDGGTLSDDYCGGLMENIRTIVNGFAGEEVLA